MNLHERQQFDSLLNTAVERFVDRIEQRNAGAAHALELLRANPNAPGVWLDEFTQALFRDFLLDNPEGHCFILCALHRRPAAPTPAATVEQSLSLLARHAFADLLRLKAEEVLEHHAGFQKVSQ